MDLTALNENFGLPGVLAFDEHDGMTRAQVTTPACEATIYFHGAHLTHWQPAGQKPVLFLSAQSAFAPDKAIRGGVPVCFPWFGPRSIEVTGSTTDGPMHGFARLQSWDLAFVALAGPQGDQDLYLTFTLQPSEASRAVGFDHFRIAYEFILGKSLTMKFTVANQAAEPLVFEEALHTYFAVADAADVTIHGLESAPYLDKTDGMKPKTMPAEPFRFTGVTDRTLPSTTATCLLEDHSNGRTITIAKTKSDTTVVWNPWAELAAKMADLGGDAWPDFVCIETVNAGANRVTLPSGETHTMTAHISVA